MEQRGLNVSGVFPPIRPKYFRIGHMGAVTSGDLLATIGAVERALRACGVSIKPGQALAAAQSELEEVGGE